MYGRAARAKVCAIKMAIKGPPVVKTSQSPTAGKGKACQVGKGMWCIGMPAMVGRRLVEKNVCNE